jgi:hypothetical protein
MTTVTRRETEVAVAVVRESTRGGMRRGIGVIRMIIEIGTEARKGVIGRGVGVAAGIEIPGVRRGGIDNPRDMGESVGICMHSFKAGF